MQFRNCFLQLLVLGTCLSGSAAFGQTRDDPWLILANGEKGSINSCTTHEGLVRTFGATNVLDKDEMDEFSGDMEQLTIVYPDDERRSIKIRWRSGDREALPASLTISGRTSRWKVAHNISLGTSLKELEQINDRAFLLSDYNWDYPGRTVVSWENGTLEQDLDGGHGKIWLRLSCPAPNASKARVEDRKDFSSHSPIFQKLNPSIHEIVLEFTVSEQKNCRTPFRR